MVDKQDSELALLEELYAAGSRNGSTLSQRQIAKSSGLSLGMTNALLRRFAEKGWVVARRINARTLQYLVTAEGVTEIARRSYRYFARTARNASFYKDRLEELVIRKKREGVSRLVLSGASELDFLLDYVAERHGLVFVRCSEDETARRLAGPGTLLIYSESRTEPALPADGLRLRDIMAGLA